MTTFSLSPVIPDLKLPRMWPCTAITGLAAMCGATPASLYHRSCVVESHARDIWLCPVHATIVMTGGAICRECAERGGVSSARVYRVVMIPVRLPKDG